MNNANRRDRYDIWRDSPPEMFSGKGVLKIYSKFTGEHPCRSVVSTKLQSNASVFGVTLKSFTLIGFGWNLGKR